MSSRLSLAPSGYDCHLRGGLRNQWHERMCIHVSLHAQEPVVLTSYSPFRDAQEFEIATVSAARSNSDMKVFLITPEGEQGPLTIAQIDCLKAEGKLNPDQHCRVEWDKEKKTLRDVMAAAAARKQILAYQADSWRAKLGTILLCVGLVLTIVFNPYNLGDALLILGIVVTAHEQARLQRAVKELSNSHTDSNLTPCTIPADESASESRGSSSSESKEFDY